MYMRMQSEIFYNDKFSWSFCMAKIISPPARVDGRYSVGEKMTLAIDINSNMVHAINGRLSDMDISVVWGADH